MLRCRVSQGAFERLERSNGKLLRSVLRGRGASNGPLLPGPGASDGLWLPDRLKLSDDEVEQESGNDFF
jgi:hypothetical protein